VSFHFVRLKTVTVFPQKTAINFWKRILRKSLEVVGLIDVQKLETVSFLRPYDFLVFSCFGRYCIFNLLTAFVMLSQPIYDYFPFLSPPGTKLGSALK